MVGDAVRMEGMGEQCVYDKPLISGSWWMEGGRVSGRHISSVSSAMMTVLMGSKTVS